MKHARACRAARAIEHHAAARQYDVQSARVDAALGVGLLVKQREQRLP
jgi:hypothetical protein